MMHDLRWLGIICFFFFKQKTAYEMRISDWSSDVCSSDLLDRMQHLAAVDEMRPRRLLRQRGNDRRLLRHQPAAPPPAGPGADRGNQQQIGRASCRARVCPYV